MADVVGACNTGPSVTAWLDACTAEWKKRDRNTLILLSVGKCKIEKRLVARLEPEHVIGIELMPEVGVPKWVVSRYREAQERLEAIPNPVGMVVAINLQWSIQGKEDEKWLNIAKNALTIALAWPFVYTRGTPLTETGIFGEVIESDLSLIKERETQQAVWLAEREKKEEQERRRIARLRNQGKLKKQGLR
jgi:signal transduction histidine kinase